MRDGKELQGKPWRARFTSFADGRGMKVTEAAISPATGSNSPYTCAFLKQQHYAYLLQLHSTKKNQDRGGCLHACGTLCM